uniref:Uncharacterized protein n=1 Tax=Arundo donax TaxID=35708 RepID=A0A0A9AE64_ARUDO
MWNVISHEKHGLSRFFSFYIKLIEHSQIQAHSRQIHYG